MKNKTEIKETIDIKGFEMLFNEYYRSLVNYGNTFIKNRDEAEDIVQQVFVSVWEKREEIKIHSSVRSMLYTSVYNACLNKIKHKKVRKVYADEVLLTQYDHQDEIILANELEEKIEKAIAFLPEQCGKIFRMSRFEQLKYQEIADQLGLSVKTVENQMGKGLRLMRESLKDYISILIYFLSTLL